MHCLSSLKFKVRYFTPKPVQKIVTETTEVTHKPTASADQSDLEFVMTTVSDTYIDLDIKLYIRGKLTKAKGTALDNNDFTAVKAYFLHTLFSQCSIAVNQVTLTQANDLHYYHSFFETILTYGSDADASHLTNDFWYLDNGHLLPCDPTAANAKRRVS